jgi:mono/diheme cytochrome c family protein
MRENLARFIAILTAGLTVLLALMFSYTQNIAPTVQVAEDSPLLPPPPLDARRQELVAPGRTIYNEQHCSLCHSIDGTGNPRYPLDGVGARLDINEMQKWIIGANELEGQMPGRAFRMKQNYRELTPDELDALVAYMQSLRNNYLSGLFGEIEG